MKLENIRQVQRELSEFALRDYLALSQNYEEKLSRLAYRTPVLMAARYAAQLPVQGRVLDLGCGTGLLGQAFRQRGLQASLVGLDLSPLMLEQVPEGIYSELHKGDCCQLLHCGDGDFQAVVSSGLSEYILDLRIWFSEVRRVLSEGSLWLFSFALSRGLPIQPIGESMLVSHSRDYVRFCLSVSGFEWQEDSEIEAYHSSGEVVTHVLTLAQARSRTVQVRPLPVRRSRPVRRRPRQQFRCPIGTRRPEPGEAVEQPIEFARRL